MARISRTHVLQILISFYTAHAEVHNRESGKISVG